MKFSTPRYSVPRRLKRESRLNGVNRHFVGESVAVIVCPAKRGLQFSVPIDRNDLERVLAAGFWRVANTYPGGKRFRLYAYTFIRENGERKRVYLHRFLTNAPVGAEVDHGNHRGTDNRRSENLSVVTHRENMLNQKRYHAATA
jgi:hypothetical protein